MGLIQTRLSIPFDGASDPTTVSSQNVFLIILQQARQREGEGSRLGIKIVVDTLRTLSTSNQTSCWLSTRALPGFVTRGCETPAGPGDASEAFRRSADRQRRVHQACSTRVTGAARRVLEQASGSSVSPPERDRRPGKNARQIHAPRLTGDSSWGRKRATVFRLPGSQDQFDSRRFRSAAVPRNATFPVTRPFPV